MTWLVDGCPALGEFETEGQALAAAWAQTMPGGARLPVREVAAGAPPKNWLGVERPKVVFDSRTESSVLLDVHALVYKEHVPPDIAANETTMLAPHVWASMDEKIRASFGPDTREATIEAVDSGYVSGRLSEGAPTGAITFRRRFRVTYE